MDLSPAWPTTADEETYWKGIREQYTLAPDEIYLNTGSFGSQPRPVLDCLLSGIREIEQSPTVNRGRFAGRVDASRTRLGAFINAPSEDLAFATNVTVAINMVVHGLDWKPGDEILASDQEYGAIENCLHLAEKRWGAVVRHANIPVPPAGPEEILDAFDAAFTDRTRLVVCSHITSHSGLITPIKALADLAHSRGARIAIDGAHAPGMIPLDLAEAGCDFYGGNCHKWLCAPKGTGFLYASPEVQDRLHHIVVSWGYSREGATRGDDGRLQIKNRPFMWGLEQWGTRDLACFVAVGAAVDFQEGIGRGRVAARGRLLASYLRERLHETGWAELITPSDPDMSGSISAFHLSGFESLERAGLYDRYRITAPISRPGPHHWLRVSTHICNGFDQIDRLMEALVELRKEGNSGAI